MNIKGKNVLITGASRGIGRYIARAVAGRGGNVALLALPDDLTRLQSLQKELARFGIQAKFFAADLSDRKQLDAAVSNILKEFGKIDILINNAAIESVAAFEHQTEQAMADAIAVNLTAPILLTKKLLPNMLAQKSGHVVVVSSYAGKIGAPYQAVYSATKAGLIKWTLALKRELKGSGVGFSAISPSYVSQSGMYFDILSKSGDKLKTPKIAGEVTPQQVAAAVIRAVTKNKTDIIVGPASLRIFAAINEITPGFVTKSFDLLGISRYNRKLTLIQIHKQGEKTP